jgi:hypothetical protein
MNGNAFVYKHGVADAGKSVKDVSTPYYLALFALSLAACIIVFLISSRFFWWLLADYVGIEIRELDPKYWPVFILSFVLFFLPWLYLFSRWVAGQFISVNVSRMILYMGCTFFFAFWFEIGVDSFFVKFLGKPCWEYRIWPVHNGYTSGVGVFMWPLYGFFVYCLNTAIENNPKLAVINHNSFKAFLMALDAMALEILANVFSIAQYHTFYFYYLPGDMVHFTTVQVFLPYMVCCAVGINTLKYLERFEKKCFDIGLVFFLLGVASLMLVTRYF